MAQYRGVISGGQRGSASRLGTKKTGLTVEAQTWQGKIVVGLYHNEKTGRDMVNIEFARHSNGAGINETLYDGPICPTPEELEEGKKQ